MHQRQAQKGLNPLCLDPLRITHPGHAGEKSVHMKGLTGLRNAAHLAPPQGKALALPVKGRPLLPAATEAPETDHQPQALPMVRAVIELPAGGTEVGRTLLQPPYPDRAVAGRRTKEPATSENTCQGYGTGPSSTAASAHCPARAPQAHRPELPTQTKMRRHPPARAAAGTPPPRASPAFPAGGAPGAGAACAAPCAAQPSRPPESG